MLTWLNIPAAACLIPHSACCWKCNPITGASNDNKPQVVLMINPKNRHLIFLLFNLCQASSLQCKPVKASGWVSSIHQDTSDANIVSVWWMRPCLTTSSSPGLCALSINHSNSYLAYPGSATIGEIIVYDANSLVSNTQKWSVILHQWEETLMLQSDCQNKQLVKDDE